MSFIVYGGAFFAFSKKAEAPPEITQDNISSMSLTLQAAAFTNGGVIPSQYSCDGEGISPELHIDNVPEGTESFVLVMDDPDIPESVKIERGIETFDHWVLYNIPSDTKIVPEGGTVGTGGLNSRGLLGYVGACPPDREHRYIFRLYALSGALNFLKAPTLREVEEAAKGMTLETAILMGRYERKNTN